MSVNILAAVYAVALIVYYRKSVTHGAVAVVGKHIRYCITTL